ncbi:hypothetical protein [Streptomyces sp. NPDC048392]|uniref:hypothetical protein n=1 Tax=Streptomyces sp. NPDC048392 TaxID=3365543 RepID=UPI0037229EC3
MRRTWGNAPDHETAPDHLLVTGAVVLVAHLLIRGGASGFATSLWPAVFLADDSRSRTAAAVAGAPGARRPAAPAVLLRSDHRPVTARPVRR